MLEIGGRQHFPEGNERRQETDRRAHEDAAEDRDDRQEGKGEDEEKGRPAPGAEIERRGTAGLAAHGDETAGPLHQEPLQPDQERDHDQKDHGGGTDDTVFRAHGGIDACIVEKGRDRLNAGRAAKQKRNCQHLDADDEIEDGRIDDRGTDHRNGDREQRPERAGTGGTGGILQQRIGLGYGGEAHEIGERRLAEAGDDAHSSNGVKIPGRAAEIGFGRQRHKAGWAVHGEPAEGDDEIRDEERPDEDFAEPLAARKIGAPDENRHDRPKHLGDKHRQRPEIQRVDEDAGHARFAEQAGEIAKRHDCGIVVERLVEEGLEDNRSDRTEYEDRRQRRNAPVDRTRSVHPPSGRAGVADIRHRIFLSGLVKGPTGSRPLGSAYLPAIAAFHFSTKGPASVIRRWSKPAVMMLSFPTISLIFWKV